MKTCECGCGMAAPIATVTNRNFGHIKGQPMRYIHGHQARRPQKDRFLKKVRLDGECWIWTAYCSKDGYGRFDGGRAHRLSYEIFKGTITKGLYVMHSCDNKRCVNPYHLSLGTAKDNTIDAARKGRLSHGERNNKAKLTDTKVAEIRRKYIPGYGGYGCRKLAAEFGVSKPTIQSILRRKTWRLSSVPA